MMDKKVNVKRYLDQFVNGQGKNNGRKPDERYASFDFCYNYFYSFYRKNQTHKLAEDKNLQMSCLQLGFYLASWGMMRGSSFLLEKSARNLMPVIEYISNCDRRLWEIDVDRYDDKNIHVLLDCKRELATRFGKESPSDTLITKIMLGVFANVPALDIYVGRSLGVHTLNKNSLKTIHDFYLQHKRVFDSESIYTFDFLSGKQTDITYTKAKLIGMCSFMQGMELLRK